MPGSRIRTSQEDNSDESNRHGQRRQQRSTAANPSDGNRGRRRSMTNARLSGTASGGNVRAPGNGSVNSDEFGVLNPRLRAFWANDANHLLREPALDLLTRTLRDSHIHHSDVLMRFIMRQRSHFDGDVVQRGSSAHITLSPVPRQEGLEAFIVASLSGPRSDAVDGTASQSSGNRARGRQRSLSPLRPRNNQVANSRNVPAVEPPIARNRGRRRAYRSPESEHRRSRSPARSDSPSSQSGRRR